MIRFTNAVNELATNALRGKIKSVLRESSRIPVPGKAVLHRLDATDYSLKVNYNFGDVDRLESVKFARFFKLKLDANGHVKELSIIPETIDISSELLSARSEQKLMAKVKTLKDENGIEIWDDFCHLKTLLPSKVKSFGKINAYDDFSTFAWSPDGTKLMFIAENYTKPKGFFDAEDPSTKEKESESVTGKEEIGNEYLYDESWGESLSEMKHPCVFVLDVNNDFKCTKIEKSDYSFLSAYWIDNTRIGFIGTPEKPYRQGMLLFARRNYLFECDLTNPEESLKIVYGEARPVSIASPRLSTDGSKVAFLEKQPSGPHITSSDLMVMDIATKQVDRIIDSSDAENDLYDSSTLKALFSIALPARCWSTGSTKIVLSSEFGSSKLCFIVDVVSKTNSKLNLPSDFVDVLDCLDDILICVCSSPTETPYILAMKCFDKTAISGDDASKQPKYLVSKSEPKILNDIVHRTDIIESPDGKSLLPAYIIGQKENMGKPSPVIVSVHGGPHCQNRAYFSKAYLFFAQCGFKVISVDYRGSTGFSKSRVESLCGKVCEYDTEDTLECIRYYQNQNEIDPDQIYLYGGSHGGLVVTFLTGIKDCEFKFRACVAINPVIDMLSLTTSDAPDWRHTEVAGLAEPFDPAMPITKQFAELCIKKSSSAYAANIKTPTLLFLGDIDLRVPHSQGLLLFRMLRGNGIDTKCFMYNDSHTLSKFKYGVDLQFNTILWFYEYAQSKK